MAKDRNTMAKRQREMEKRRKADEKRDRRIRRKSGLEIPSQVDLEDQPIVGEIEALDASDSNPESDLRNE